MAYCLPQDATKKFIEALKSGTINPDKMVSMSSDERRTFFEGIVGKNDAAEVNAQLEAKLLLKDQKTGMVTWAKKITGITEAQRSDLVSKINKMDRILNASDKQSFLADLASKKLKTEVTFEEAKNIAKLSKKGQDTKTELQKDPFNKAKQIAYGRSVMDISDYVDSLKPSGGLKNTLINIANIPKTALTSILHFSAPFVQGWGMLSTKSFYEAAGQMFKYFVSDKSFKDLQASIIGHPDYKFAQDGKLGITRIGDKLNDREEAIQSNLLQKIPVLGKLVTASSRGFTGFLNYLRFDRFTKLLASARLNGEDVNLGSRNLKDIANVVNDFTGRGHLPFGLDRSTALLNTMFFSPRKIAATMEMFNPVRYVDPRISPTAKMAALRQLTGSIVVTASVLELAHLAGASVNLNPTAQNFMKAKFGNTTLDMTGGNAIYVRLLARLFTGKSTSASGKIYDLTSGKYGGETRADVAISYFRDKLAPLAGSVANLLYGKNPIGQPVTLGSEVAGNLTPIVISEFINLMQDNANISTIVLPELAAIFGVSVSATKP